MKNQGAATARLWRHHDFATMALKEPDRGVVYRRAKNLLGAPCEKSDAELPRGIRRECAAPVIARSRQTTGRHIDEAGQTS
jgi:hypothetical protein